VDRERREAERGGDLLSAVRARIRSGLCAGCSRVNDHPGGLCLECSQLVDSCERRNSCTLWGHPDSDKRCVTWTGWPGAEGRRGRKLPTSPDCHQLARCVDQVIL
jgi:hypothetical protein